MKIFLCFFLFCLQSFLFAENTAISNKKKTLQVPVKHSEKVLPDHFRSVSLLMNYSDVFKQLSKDTLLLLQNSEFEDFDEENPHWITAKFPPLMPHIYYHFYKDQLYIISLFFSKKRTSYSELYKQLKKKYGNPQATSAQETTWKIDRIKLILDPLPSLKYIYTPLLNKVANSHHEKNFTDSSISNEHKLEQKILNEL